MELDGWPSPHALVHISQLAPRRVETVDEVVATGDRVWVVILKEERPGRLSASMKMVDQASGALVEGGASAGPSAGKRRRDADDADDAAMATMTWGLQPLERDAADEGSASAAPAAPKAQPNYGTTGKLAEETNKLNGVVVKYSEPEDAAKPSVKWRLYVFKGKEALEPYHIHRQSAYLLGRERRVCDIPLDHPSCSSQHAALQFRMTVKPAADDETRTTRQVRPYLIDVGSTNGSYVNNERIEPQRFVELLEKDVLRFGYSSREYVLLHDNSAS